VCCNRAMKMLVLLSRALLSAPRCVGRWVRRKGKVSIAYLKRGEPKSDV
jgi:hypothetical protein